MTPKELDELMVFACQISGIRMSIDTLEKVVGIIIHRELKLQNRPQGEDDGMFTVNLKRGKRKTKKNIKKGK